MIAKPADHKYLRCMYFHRYFVGKTGAGNYALFYHGGGFLVSIDMKMALFLIINDFYFIHQIRTIKYLFNMHKGCTFSDLAEIKIEDDRMVIKDDSVTLRCPMSELNTAFVERLKTQNFVTELPDIDAFIALKILEGELSCT